MSHFSCYCLRLSSVAESSCLALFLPFLATALQPPSGKIGQAQLHIESDQGTDPGEIKLMKIKRETNFHQLLIQFPAGV